MSCLSEEILRRVEEHFKIEYARINVMPPQRAAEEIGNEQRVCEQLDLMKKLIGEPLIGKCMLEIGNGIGLLQAVALGEGIKAFGVDPDSFNQDVTRAVLDGHGIGAGRTSLAFGERLPFGDNTFDVVCSFLVLEHVNDPRAVLTEATRVLKPGGYIHFVAPNYGSIWEGHYNLPWIPYSPKWLARLYVWIWRRDPSYLNQLQMVTPMQLRRIVAHLPLQVQSWGIEVWEYRLETLDFSDWSELQRLKTVVHWVHRLHLVELVRFFGRRLDLFTPIILTARRIR